MGRKGKPTAAPAVRVAARCKMAECKEKDRLMGFCEEHFIWFKYGLVNRQGEKPKDFDKKYQIYLRKTAGVA